MFRSLKIEEKTEKGGHFSLYKRIGRKVRAEEVSGNESKRNGNTRKFSLMYF